jgi:hypothetical protein
VQRKVFDSAAIEKLQRICLDFDEGDVTYATIFLDDSDHYTVSHWDPKYVDIDVNYWSVGFTAEKSSQVADIMFGGETPWSNVRFRAPTQGLECVSIRTGGGWACSDSKTHYDPMHHLLVAAKGERTVFMWEPRVSAGACHLALDFTSSTSNPGVQIPMNDFYNQYKQLGFTRAHLEEGDALLIERYRPHRVFGAPDSLALAFAVQIQRPLFDGDTQ